MSTYRFADPERVHIGLFDGDKVTQIYDVFGLNLDPSEHANPPPDDWYAARDALNNGLVSDYQDPANKAKVLEDIWRKEEMQLVTQNLLLEQYGYGADTATVEVEGGSTATTAENLARYLNDLNHYDCSGSRPTL